MSTSADALEGVRQAMQAFVNAKNSAERENGYGGGPFMLTDAVVFYQCSALDDNGNPYYITNYCIPTDGTPASAYGAAALGIDDLKDDLLGRDRS